MIWNPTEKQRETVLCNHNGGTVFSPSNVAFEYYFYHLTKMASKITPTKAAVPGSQFKSFEICIIVELVLINYS
jgi:hypothetical protein